MTINVLYNSSLEKARYYGSQLRTHLKISPLNLGLLVLPGLLTVTMASSVYMPESAIEPVPNIQPESADAHQFEGEVISFSYPSEWRVDSTRTSPRKVVLEIPQAVKPSTITIHALSEPLGSPMEHLVESVENNPEYDHYFLRKKRDHFIQHEPVVNLHYTAITEDGISIRGLKMAFIGADEKPYILDLRTQFPNSLGNDLQVKKMTPYSLDLIKTMK